MLRAVLLLLFFSITTMTTHADPIASTEMEVVDGDTIKVRGSSYRMVGYDTPETKSRGRRVVGPDERAVANLAAERFQELINSGTLDLNDVPCACPAGTHGTKACNNGRKCAILSLNGKNIGDTLIAEELAVPFVCGPTRCPRMPDWRRIIERQHNQ